MAQPAGRQFVVPLPPSRRPRGRRPPGPRQGRYRGVPAAVPPLHSSPDQQPPAILFVSAGEPEPTADRGFAAIDFDARRTGTAN